MVCDGMVGCCAAAFCGVANVGWMPCPSSRGFCGYDESGRAVGGPRVCGLEGMHGLFCGKRSTDTGKMDQVPLFYEVPMGSMEAYRAAVEAEHARSEEVWSR